VSKSKRTGIQPRSIRNLEPGTWIPLSRLVWVQCDEMPGSVPGPCDLTYQEGPRGARKMPQARTWTVAPIGCARPKQNTRCNIPCRRRNNERRGTQVRLVRAKSSSEGVERETEEEWPARLGQTALLVSPFFFWGTAMVAMKGVLTHVGPTFVATVRLVPAGLLLVAYAAATGRKQPNTAQAWGAIALFALVDAAAFQGCLAQGLERTSAGLGSVIIDSQPITVALLAAIFFGEKIGSKGAAGMVLGILGLCMLEVPPQVLQDGLEALGQVDGGIVNTMLGTQPALVEAQASVPGSVWDSGAWWMLLAAQSMAVGTVMVPWVCRFADPIAATGWHMIIGGLPLLALSLAQEGSLAEELARITPSDTVALLYTSLLGSAVSYGVFFYNASKGNLTKLSSLTFLTPVFAAVFGFLLLGETLNAYQLSGASVTLLAIYLINARAEDKDGKISESE